MTTRVEPPAEHRGVRWHWLAHEDGPRLASWLPPIWALVSEFGTVIRTPAEMAKEGYRYLAPCIPPEPRDVG